MSNVDKKDLELYRTEITDKLQEAPSMAEFERQAYDYPLEAVEEGMSDVGEGTTATIVDETPKRICPEAPELKIKTLNKAWGLLIEHLFNTKVIEQANTQFPYLDKFQQLVEIGAIFGSSFAEVIETDGEWGVDFRIPAFQNVITEARGQSLYEANHFFIEQRWTKLELEHLIEAQSKDKSTKWDVRALKELMKKAPGDDNSFGEDSGSVIRSYEAQSLADAARYLVVRLIREDKQTWFCPSVGGLILKEEQAGFMPVIPYYHKVVIGKTYGLGIVHYLNPNQEVMDRSLRYHTRSNELGILPPFFTTGISNLENLVLEPSAIIKGGQVDSKFDPVNITTDALRGWTPQDAYRRNLMYNKVGAYDRSSGGTTGVPHYSQTPKGVESQESRQGANDLPLRKRLRFTAGRLFKLMCQLMISKQSKGKGAKTYRLPKSLYLDIIKYKPEWGRTIAEQKKDGAAAEGAADYETISVDWSDFNVDDVDAYTMKYDADWMIDKVSRVEKLGVQLRAWLGQPPYSDYLSAADIVKMAVRDLNFPDDIVRGERSKDVVSVENIKAFIEETLKKIQGSQQNYNIERLEIERTQTSDKKEIDLKKLALEKDKLELEALKVAIPPEQVIGDGAPTAPEQGRPAAAAPPPGLAGVVHKLRQAGAGDNAVAKAAAVVSQIRNEVITPEQGEAELEEIRAGVGA